MNKQTTELVGFDPVGIIKALGSLGDALPGNHGWLPLATPPRAPKYALQAKLLDLYYVLRNRVEKLPGVTAKASRDGAVLDAFLQVNGFDPMFGDLGDTLGAVALLSKAVEWARQGTPSQITRLHPDGTETAYPAFELSGGFSTFSAHGGSHPLVQLHATDGSSVWIMMIDAPENNLALVDKAEAVLNTRRSDGSYTSITVPTVEISASVDVDWMTGMRYGYGAQAPTIGKSFQVIKFRMNETGAAVKTATGLGFESCVPPLMIDRPFLLFFTDPAAPELPIAPMYISEEFWRAPSGDLTEL